MKSWLGAIILVMGLANGVRADIPGGGGSRNRNPYLHPHGTVRDYFPLLLEHFPLTMEGQNSQTVVRLVLPKSLVKKMQTALAPPEGSPWSIGQTPLSSIVAGLALSLSVVYGGFLLARARPRMVYAACGFVLVTLCAVGISCLPLRHKDMPANAGPATLARAADGTLAGRTQVEVGEDSEGVKLYVNRGQMADFIRDAGVKADMAP
jgi:hypothetical protein